MIRDYAIRAALPLRLLPRPLLFIAAAALAADTPRVCRAAAIAFTTGVMRIY